MAKLLNNTQQVRKILKANGFKNGQYRIQNRSNKYAKAGREYKNTYIHMRVSVSPEVIKNIIRDGLTLYLPSDKPIFKY